MKKTIRHRDSNQNIVCASQVAYRWAVAASVFYNKMSLTLLGILALAFLEFLFPKFERVGTKADTHVP